jgi:hypothetical protein
METADALATLSRAGLSSVTADLRRLLAPSIRATASRVDEPSLAVGSSKLGGQPDLPIGAAWPVKTQPLGFVGQVRLGDLREFEQYCWNEDVAVRAQRLGDAWVVPQSE